MLRLVIGGVIAIGFSALELYFLNQYISNKTDQLMEV